MAIKDLSGQTFGQIKVLYLDEEKTNEKHRSYWYCQCEACGKIFSRRQDQIINKSGEDTCGCTNSNVIKDETGKRYGHLTVLSRAGKTNDGQATWLCRCDCGKTLEIRGAALRRGQQSCNDCEYRYKEKNTTLIDRTGLKYGFLTVLERDKENQTNKNTRWWCRCELCGSIVSVLSYHLVTGHTVSCGCVKSKGETAIRLFLQAHGVKFQGQYSFNDFRFPDTQGVPKYDFALFNQEGRLTFLIEYNGEQHYKETNFFKSDLATTKKRDQQKIDYCQQNNIPLEIIPYTKYDKLEEILTNLLIKYNLN